MIVGRAEGLRPGQVPDDGLLVVVPQWREARVRPRGACSRPQDEENRAVAGVGQPCWNPRPSTWGGCTSTVRSALRTRARTRLTISVTAPLVRSLRRGSQAQAHSSPRPPDSARGTWRQVRRCSAERPRAAARVPSRTVRRIWGNSRIRPGHASRRPPPTPALIHARTGKSRGGRSRVALPARRPMRGARTGSPQEGLRSAVPCLVAARLRGAPRTPTSRGRRCAPGGPGPSAARRPVSLPGRSRRIWARTRRAFRERRKRHGRCSNPCTGAGPRPRPWPGI